MKIIGLMSGTSVDGVDAALVEVTGQGYDIAVELIAGDTFAYPEDLRSQILAVCAGDPLSLSQLAQLDDAIATSFADAAKQLIIATSGVNWSDVELIASHGQTVFHRPPPPDTPESKPELKQLGYSLQLGRGAMIAAQTHCPVASNFRQGDIALGGQGAPLVPPIDACLLSHSTHTRCVQNIGGIGNVTYLPAWDRASVKTTHPLSKQPQTFPSAIQGWDTGPGNALIDWAMGEFTHGQQSYDKDGLWAAQGQVCYPLITRWLEQPFFDQPPPKSTGRELFGADYAEQCWRMAQQDYQLTQVDFIATLTMFTATTIAHNYRQFLPGLPDEVLLCGGGSRNPHLRRQLQHLLPDSNVLTTDEVGLSADFKEAIAFAVLGFWRWHQVPGNLPSATGASTLCLLGELIGAS